MLFAIWSTGGPDTDAIRARARADHLRFVIEHRATLRFGGACVDAKSGAMTGMLMVIDVANLRQAKAFVNAEPYSRAGAFSRIVIKPFALRFPEPVEGFFETELDGELRQYGKPLNPI